MAASKDVVVDEESGRTVRVARPNMHDLNLPEGGSILDKPATKWDKEEVVDMKAQYEDIQGTNDDAYTKYNPDPGTGRTGYHRIPPNNYPFYEEEEKYVPVVQADGGVLSEWKPLYNPTPEQAEIDRKKAYETGVPHGYVPAGDKYAGQPTISLLIKSELHDETEYGVNVDENGRHTGGPFRIDVSPKMRIVDLRMCIKEKSGILPGLMRFSYAGKQLDDAQRTLEHYGVKYWNAKFPDWPLVIRRF